MDRGSLVQDILNEVSSRIISFQIRLHLLITLVKSSEYFRFIKSLRTCIMASQTADTELTIPNTKHPFFITVDASLVGLGAVLFQMNETNKMKVVSYNSRILNTQEQKLSTLDRELFAIVYALQIYEFLIIGSPHHKPLLHCFA